MPRKQAKQSVEDLPKEQDFDATADVVSDVSETTTETSADTAKPKRQSQKEPYKPFLLVADLGRSSCKFFVYLKEDESESKQTDIVYSKTE